MRVNQLIAALQRLPADHEVVIENSEFPLNPFDLQKISIEYAAKGTEWNTCEATHKDAQPLVVLS